MNTLKLLISIFISIFLLSPKISNSFSDNYEVISSSLIQKTAKGYVYHDKNENQIMDEGEEGIEGVFVSNGVDIVETDKNGRYKISVSEDAIIFVIKPRDWITPVNELNLPQFYYIHKPGGSPDNFVFKGVDPTGSLPSNINFPLYSESGKSKFKMIVFGDPQPYDLEQVDFFSEKI